MSQKQEEKPEAAAAPKEESEPIDDGPVFSLKPAIALDMLQDWVATLRRENFERIQKSNVFDGLFVKTRSMEFLCVLCEQLNVTPNVKFMAAALFDAFMLRHVRSCREDWKKSKATAKDKDWQTTEDKISSQVSLRMFSCVQIASKMENSLHCVQINDFNRLLRNMGLCYTSDHILKSELRVLKTLDFKINVASPLVFVETILKLLHIECPILPVDVWYKWSIMVLETVLLLRDDVYVMWAKEIIGDTVSIERSGLARVQSDYTLLASSVIVAGAYVVSGTEVAMEVAKVVCRTAGVSFNDITHFCSVFIQVVLRPRQPVAESVGMVSVDAALQTPAN